MSWHVILRPCFKHLWACHYPAIWSEVFHAVSAKSRVFLAKFQQKRLCHFWKSHLLKISYLAHKEKEDPTAISLRNSSWRETTRRHVQDSWAMNMHQILLKASAPTEGCPKARPQLWGLPQVMLLMARCGSGGKKIHPSLPIAATRAERAMGGQLGLRRDGVSEE